MKYNLLLALTVMGNSMFAQTADQITIIDTRSVNDAPSSFKYEARFHFKQSSVVGLPVSAYYSGVLTVAPWGDNSGNKHHQIGFNETGLFWRTGTPQSSSWDSWNRILTSDANGNVGIGTTTPNAKLDVNGSLKIPVATTVDNQSPGLMAVVNDDFQYDGEFLNHYGLGFHGYNDGNGYNGLNAYLSSYYGIDLFTGGTNRLRINNNGNVGIGTTTPGSFKLAVNGKIWATEVQVALTNPGPDYVFEKDYDLISLEEIKTYIEKNKHLPEVPSAKEMETNGINLSEMNMLLLKKIEELTLYQIQLEKRISDLEGAKKTHKKK